MEDGNGSGHVGSVSGLLQDPDSRQLPSLAEPETPPTCEALWLAAEVDRGDLLALVPELPTDRKPRLAIDGALTAGQTVR